jgi:hypothetical protein
MKTHCENFGPNLIGFDTIRLRKTIQVIGNLMIASIYDPLRCGIITDSMWEKAIAIAECTYAGTMVDEGQSLQRDFCYFNCPREVLQVLRLIQMADAHREKVEEPIEPTD